MRNIVGRLFNNPDEDPQSQGENALSDVDANAELSKQYARTASAMAKRFAPRSRSRSGEEVTVPGQVQSVEKLDDGVKVNCDRAALAITFKTPNIIEVRLRADKQFREPFSYAIDPAFSPEPVEFLINEAPEAVNVTAGKFMITVERRRTRLIVKYEDTAVLTGGNFQWQDSNIKFSRDLPEGEYCHGLGERAYGLNLRGKTWALWNTDPFDMTNGYMRETDPIYFSIPFYFGLHKDYAVGIFWDNPARGEVDLGETDPQIQTFMAEDNELRLYVIADKTPPVVLQQYMDLTGRPPLPPMWAMGYHQSRYSYRSPDDFRYIAHQLRSRNIPCDVLHFDIDYMEQFRVFTWNRDTFGDIKSLVNELHKQGFRCVAILDPGIKVDDQYPSYIHGSRANAFITYPDGDLFIAPVWAGNSAFPDFNSERGRSFWAKEVASFIEKTGFDGLWNDMNEPTIFMPGVPGTFPDYLPSDWEGDGKRDHVAGPHNTYGAQMARATFQGMQQANPQKRAFNLTRAGYAGAQRYTASWTGDNTSNWDHLRLSISMLLNLGLSGMYFTGPDIGGFFDIPSGELYVRWIQAASLFPFCRTHTAKGSPAQEPWSFGDEMEAICRKFIELRYQLLPYLYSSYVKACKDGIPFIRPTFLNEPCDPQTFGQDDVYVIGDEMLVAPVLEKGATSKTFYLPRGMWFNWWTRRITPGGRQITVDAPLDEMPIYVKAGSVIPTYPVQQYVGEQSVEEVHLNAFAGVLETTFYEDAGEGMGYLDGDYRWSYFSTKFMPGNVFAVEWRTAGNFKPSYRQARLEVIGITEDPDEIVVDDQPGGLWFYENGVVEVLVNPFNQVKIIGKSISTDETVVRRPPGLDFD